MVHLIVALHALGKAEIVTPLARLTPAQGREFAASLYLFLERAKPVARAMLAELLWPGTADATRQHRMRQMLLELRRSGIPVVTNRDTLSLTDESRKSDLDILFIHGAGDIDSIESLHFLPGYAPQFSPAFSHWLDTKRTEVSAATSRLLINDIRRARSRGDWLRVERLALKCMDVDAFNEEAVLARAEASAMRGAKREAVSILDRYVADLGPGSGDIKLPANLMRKRIAERVPEAAFQAKTESIFVGREADMHQLTALLEDARAGSGRCCLLWGDAGIGKSRLASELGRFGELQGVQFRRVACRRGDAQRPLSVFVEAVPQLREMRGALGCSPDTMSDLQRLTQFDVTASAKQAAEMDPQSIFELIRLAIFDLIDAVSEEQCLMLVVEDVHWLDAASARILGQLTDWAAKKHLLLIFTSRLRDNPLLEACTRAGLVTHQLRPISPEASTQLVREMFDATNEKGDEEFLEWCRKVGDGNPFFLHELVKQWLETKQRHAIPPSITSVIRERFSRLSSEGTHVLQACSILGENSTLPRVEKVLQLEPYLLLGALNELSKAAMLSSERKVTTSSGDFRLTTKHDLISTVALDELDPHAAAFLHRRAGEILEAELGEETQDTALLWACAQHWQKAGDEEKSLTLAVRCAELLLRLGCPKDAADIFARSSSYTSNPTTKLNLLDRRITALQIGFEYADIRDAIRIARATTLISQNSHDKYELFDLEARWQTEMDQKVLIAQLLPCVHSSTAGNTHRVSAGCLALKIGTNLCDWKLLDDVYQTIEPLLPNADDSTLDRTMVPLIYHAMRGDGSQIDPLTDRLLKHAAQVHNPHLRANAFLNAGFANLLFGNLARAEELMLKSYEVALEAKLLRRAWYTSLELVRFYLDLNRVDSAESWISKFDHASLSFTGISVTTHHAFAAAKLAVARNNLSEARFYLEILNSVPIEEQSPMRRNATLAIAVRYELLKAGSSPELADLVRELEHFHEQNRTGGRQDYEAYSLYLGLEATGQKEKGRQLMRDYMKNRRELNAPLMEISIAARAENRKEP